MNPLLAQIGAEVRMRLRSPATLIAILAFVVGAFFWIPDPHGTATSLSWPPQGFTLDWWRKAFEADCPRDALYNSVKLALAATANASPTM